MSEQGHRARIATIARQVGFVLDLAAAAMFLVIFVAIVAQTTMRYVFGSPLTTSQEIATLAFIWLIFWAIGCNLSIGDHVRFDIVYNLASDWTRRLMSVVCNVLFLGIFVAAIPDTLAYFEFLRFQYTASLGITYQIAFFTYFVFAVAFPMRLAANLALLLGPGWKGRL